MLFSSSKLDASISGVLFPIIETIRSCLAQRYLRVELSVGHQVSRTSAATGSEVVAGAVAVSVAPGAGLGSAKAPELEVKPAAGRSEVDVPW